VTLTTDILIENSLPVLRMWNITGKVECEDEGRCRQKLLLRRLMPRSVLQYWKWQAASGTLALNLLTPETKAL